MNIQDIDNGLKNSSCEVYLQNNQWVKAFIENVTDELRAKCEYRCLTW